jgi:hypothetical protein
MPEDVGPVGISVGINCTTCGRRSSAFRNYELRVQTSETLIRVYNRGFRPSGVA